MHLAKKEKAWGPNNRQCEWEVFSEINKQSQI